MHLYYLLGLIQPITLQHLPWLPWWGWLIALLVCTSILILINPFPWWGWLIYGVGMVVYLLLSWIVYLIESGV